jgi:ABC-type phosphate transport system substrate-binding protein
MKNACKITVILIAVMLIGSMSAVAQTDGSDFVIIANKQMAGSAINESVLRGIYLREVRNWSSGGAEIIPVDLSTGNDFYQNLFGRSYVEMQAYWLNMRIRHSVNLPITQKDANSVKNFVASNKDAIGFIKSSDVDDTIKVLKVMK